MLNALTFLFGDWVTRLFSLLVRSILKTKGVNVGKGLRAEGFPHINLARNTKLVLGKNVILRRGVELWTRNQGSIIIGDNVRLDRDVRLVAANTATLTLGKCCRIGAMSIINAGADVTLGNKVLMAGSCLIQASDHGLLPLGPVADLPHTYAPVRIGEGSWIASHACILKGASIGTGVVIAAGAVVRNDIPDYMIAGGVPARLLRARKSDDASQ